MDIVFLVVGALVGLIAGVVFANRKADATLDHRLSEKLEELRDQTVEKTKKRVEAELREELTSEVRDELKDKYDEEIKASATEQADRKLEDAQSKADALRKEAQLEADSIKLEAQKEAEKELKERRAELQKLEERLTNRETKLDGRASKLDERDEEASRREERINTREQALNEREEELSRHTERVQAELEKVAGYTSEEAKEQLIDSMVAEAKAEATQKVREVEESAMDEADKRAKKVLATAIQRYAGEYVTERTVKVVQLPSDDMKGRIIGREGRNIRALEAATGIDIIVDDTPEVVVVSGFDPVRREIARLSLEKLIADGRIHPARIEEVVEKTEQEIAQVIKESGEQAAFELGVHGLHPEITKLLGRLKWRTSYGQNMWSHSIEVGFLCGLMASELGVDVKLARRAGLLHDMGKALTHERDGSHALVGAEIAKKHGETEIVRNAIAAHHDEEPQNSVIAHLVIAADALSGARPGARREILGTYVKRLEELEKISLGFDGVEKTYAIQAGREIRVMVSNSKVSDNDAYALSKDIARKIEDELTYPGQVKVCVIRETRAVDFAK
ncbi:ribonuclease Y [Persicimonas caeni]|uniref:Ribonuclease Y n=1 Tax=Persicimonas caeni TaxID=2292766 RepID=A0A4Y6PYI1_PERCE|nr:ribonuclease Y [Persicimonas caeni]QDG53371.1 ribonuclease Y [Persicimonas caeni]QED34592.1 ribonuclease Y [Persicimonas caeni]